jgi:RHS repeat-associated protein
MYLFSGSQDVAEYDNGAAPSSPSSEFIYSDSLPGSGLLAGIVAGTTTYFHSDHLSWRVSTNTSGQVVGQQGTFPFGESWYSSSANEFVFTSYQRDVESGLDYAMARYYDSTVGRFCSADPLGGQVGDPQTWNRYAYGRNDPINLTDPSGQGWLNWLELAGSLVADFFTAGATTPETADLTATLLGIQQETAAIATMVAITQVGNQTNPKGQTEQTNPEGQTQTPEQQTPLGTAQQQRVNCVTIALNNQFPGAGFQPDPNKDPRSQGGHINPTETATVPTQTAQDIQTQLQSQTRHSLIPGARYPSGLHLPQPPTTTPSLDQPGMSTISISGHVDSATPVDVATGTKHLVWDVVWGTVKQKIFHGNIDKRCPI